MSTLDSNTDIPRIDPLEIEKMLGIKMGETPYPQYRKTIQFFLDDLRRSWPTIYGEVFIHSLVSIDSVAEIVEFQQRNRLMVESEHEPTGDVGSVHDPVVLTPLDSG